MDNSTSDSSDDSHKSGEVFDSDSSEDSSRSSAQLPSTQSNRRLQSTERTSFVMNYRGVPIDVGNPDGNPVYYLYRSPSGQHCGTKYNSGSASISNPLVIRIPTESCQNIALYHYLLNKRESLVDINVDNDNLSDISSGCHDCALSDISSSSEDSDSEESDDSGRFEDSDASKDSSSSEDSDESGDSSDSDESEDMSDPGDVDRNRDNITFGYDSDFLKSGISEQSDSDDSDVESE